METLMAGRRQTQYGYRSVRQRAHRNQGMRQQLGLSAWVIDRCTKFKSVTLVELLQYHDEMLPSKISSLCSTLVKSGQLVELERGREWALAAKVAS